ncbi:MAG: arginine--tRNA ligase [Polyangiales bacterium]
MRLETYLSERVSAGLYAILGVENAPALLRRTQHKAHGDYQINALLPLAKKLGQAPRALGEALLPVLMEEPAVARAEVAGPGFVNLHLDVAWLAQHVLLPAYVDPDRLDVEKVTEVKRVVVDFSSPNVAKEMHVGHLRSTILGDALVRLLRLVGHEVIGDNHLGDWGTQFGLILAHMERFGSGAGLGQDAVAALERIYKEASALAGEDEDFAASGRAALAELQAGDADKKLLWQQCIAATRQALDANYDRLGIHFDLTLGESAYHDALPGVIETLRRRGLAREDAGALCVFVHELEGVPAALKKVKTPFIVQKRDGAFLYSTTDIATALDRHARLQADVALYVVDARQSLHFRQLFAVCAALDVPLEMVHVAFGAILDAHGKPLKTRDGGTIRLRDLLDEAQERARRIIEAQGLEIDAGAVEAVARSVGIGAVKYADLRQNRLSDYQFDWDKMLSFHGNAGPYLQYAYARTASILRKAEARGIGLPAACDLDAVALTGAESAERELMQVLARFADVVHHAAQQYEPHLLTDHLYALARHFSALYEQCPILRAEGSRQRWRLMLVALCGQQLKLGLRTLGIDVVERM